MIIGLLNQKGGVGKTTLAIHLATAFALQKKRVLLVDADPQGSALDWAASRQEEELFSVIGLPKAILHKNLPDMAADYDYIIIDGPPRSYEVARSAIMASDYILLPVQPSPYDIWAAKEIVDLIEEAKVYKGDTKCAFVINRKITNTAIGRDVRDALSGYQIGTLDAAICQRVLFAESAASGSTVLEQAPTSSAAQEIISLTTEILEALHGKENQSLASNA